MRDGNAAKFSWKDRKKGFNIPGLKLVVYVPLNRSPPSRHTCTLTCINLCLWNKNEFQFYFNIHEKKKSDELKRVESCWSINQCLGTQGRREEKNFKENDSRKENSFLRTRGKRKMKEMKNLHSQNESGFCRCFVCLFSISHDPEVDVYTDTHMTGRGEKKREKCFEVEQ
jgi:hypothetical protein